MIFVKSFDFRVPKIKRLEGNSKVITVKYGKGTNDNALKQQICDYNGDVRSQCKACLMCRGTHASQKNAAVQC